MKAIDLDSREDSVREVSDDRDPGRDLADQAAEYREAHDRSLVVEWMTMPWKPISTVSSRMPTRSIA
ncbi:hypothetical protein [Methylobacterium sp.]|uniref:hypothetical protein n=1 Tax=Methylobacterium sp. TaxID=409 RepID=UPI003B0217D5